MFGDGMLVSKACRVVSGFDDVKLKSVCSRKVDGFLKNTGGASFRSS